VPGDADVLEPGMLVRQDDFAVQRG